MGKRKVLYVGNLNAKRDWGYAGDYVKAMHKMLQLKNPTDFVISTGKTTRVIDFINLSLKYLKINFKWVGKGLNKVAIDTDKNKVIIKINKDYFRPAEVDLLIGRSTKAKKILKWKPETSLEKLVKIMIDFDLKNY